MTTTVSIIGLGVMGSRMVPHLARSPQISLTSVFDANAGAVAAVARSGVKALAMAPDAAESDIVVLMLPNSDVVDAVLGSDDDPASLASRLGPGTLVVDMGSSIPARTAALGARLAERGVRLVDAPVSGGPRKAATSELTIMAGGAEADVEAARPVLDAVGTSTTCTGPVGSAHALKALNNLLSMIGFVGALEVFTVGAKFGLEPRTMLEVINQATGRNQSTEVKFDSAIIGGNYDVGFSLELSVKDIGTAIDLGAHLGLDLPVSRSVVEFARDALAWVGDANPDQSEMARYLAKVTDVSLVRD